MSAASSPPVPVRLAATGAGVVGSTPIMTPPLDTTARMRRAKERLYVLCQVGGWGGFIALQLMLGNATRPKGQTVPITDYSSLVMVMLLGLLLVHYARALVRRWGWKELGWAGLIPRVLALSAVLTVLWSGLGFGYLYGIMQLPWKSKLPMPLAFMISMLNGMVVFVFWFAVYFVYNAFERLQRMQVEQLRLAANVKEAELRALKAQVNPHFLFNSLNSLRALIDEDAPRARTAVTRLANILRYSLQSGQLQTVPLAQEIEVVRDYLLLEQIRYEQRLRVRWEIEDEARLGTLLVPPMLLQTLVENAVKYGIGARRDGGELFIGIRREGETLRVRVVNPGEISLVSAPSTGVGLRNAAERLTLLYGDRATLSLLAEPVGCVTAHVLIPLRSPAP